MSDLILDPAKTYAEMKPFTNIVARVFMGETIPGWSIYPGRIIVEVPQGQTANVGDRYHNGVFAPLPPELTLDQKADAAIDRFLFEVNFDQENRLRLLEAKPEITRVQYRNALITRWKELNP